MRERERERESERELGRKEGREGGREREREREREKRVIECLIVRWDPEREETGMGWFRRAICLTLKGQERETHLRLLEHGSDEGFLVRQGRSDGQNGVDTAKDERID